MKKFEKELLEEQFERDMKEVKANVIRCVNVIPKGTHPSIVALVGSQLLSAAIAEVADGRLQLDFFTRKVIKLVKSEILEMYKAKEEITT